MDIQVGNIVKLKKQHPCGSHEWEVLRIGADFRIKCLGCEHQIMIARKLVEKNTKEISGTYRDCIACFFKIQFKTNTTVFFAQFARPYKFHLISNYPHPIFLTS